MFRFASDGMEGSASLMLLHLGLTRRAPSKPGVTGQAWEGLLGSKAKRRVLAAVDPAHPSKEGKAHERRDLSQCEAHGGDAKGHRQVLPGPDELGYASPRRRNPGQEASDDRVRHMENLLLEAESNVLRCWAGVQCAMAHGCLRWADLQATPEKKKNQR